MFFDTNFVPKCEHPLMINGKLVPCGHCSLCLFRQKKEWIFRCACEFSHDMQGYFITLTFDNDHLSDTSYTQVRSFFKLLRQAQGSFKYFGVFERGEYTFRPHFHILLFHVKLLHFEKSDSDYLQKLWKNGFVQCDFLNLQQIYYTVGYVQKKLLQSTYFTKEEREIKDYRKHNKFDPINLNRKYYHFQSRGLGFSYFFKHVNEIVKNGYCVFNGVKYSCPRSFKYALKYRNEDLYNDLFGNNEQLNFDYLELLEEREYNIKDCDIEYYNKCINENKQRSLNIYGKQKDTKYNEFRAYRAAEIGSDQL